MLRLARSRLTRRARLVHHARTAVLGLVAVLATALLAGACSDLAGTSEVPAADTQATAGGSEPTGAPEVPDAAEATSTLPVSLTPASPSVLPEGAVVYYVDAAGIRRMDQEGDRLLTDEARPGVLYPSPDGRWVAYPAQFPEEKTEGLRVLSAESGKETARVLWRDLPPPESAAAGTDFASRATAQIGWSPDGSRMYFTTVGLRAEGAPVRLDDLWELDAASGDLTQVLAPGDGGLFAFSLDGAKVAVTRAPTEKPLEETLAVADADGARLQELGSYQGLDVEGNQGISNEPQWVDDGASVLVSVYPAGTTLRDFPAVTGELRRYWLDGRTETVSELPGYALRVRAGYGVSASPDGRWIGVGLPSAEATPTPPAAGGEQADGFVRPRRVVLASIDDVPAGGWAEAKAYDEGESTFFEAWSPDGGRFTYSMQLGRTADERPALHVGTMDEEPHLVIENDRLDIPYWLSPDDLLLLLDEGEPWLVLAGVDGELALLARVELPADGSANRPTIAVVPATR